MERTAEALHRRARPVGGELHHRRPGQPFAPVGELALQHLALQPAALPQREVGILQRQLRQRRGLALDEGVVEPRHFGHQDSPGPAIRDDVVNAEQQDVLRRAQPREAHP